MATIKRFEDLDIWKDARRYVDQEAFGTLKTSMELLSGKIGGFINYLNNNNYKGVKFRRSDNDGKL